MSFYDKREEEPIFKMKRPSKDLVIDYKDIETLKPFLTEAGKILPQRISGLSAKQQRRLQKQVKRARHLAYIPFVSAHTYSN